MAKNKTPQVPPMDAVELPNMEQPSTEQPNMEQPKAEPKKVKLTLTTLTRKDVKAEPQFPLGFEEDFNEHLKNAANPKANPNQVPPELMEFVGALTEEVKAMHQKNNLFSLYMMYLKKGYQPDEAMTSAKSAHQVFYS